MQPARDHDLPLIAAGEVAHENIGARRADAELHDVAFDLLTARAAADDAAPRKGGGVGEREILLDRHHLHQRLAAPVLRNESDSRLHRRARRVDLDPLAGREERAARARVGAENATHEFGAARADQARQTIDLAATEFEADALKPRIAQSFYPQRFLAIGAFGALMTTRQFLGQRASGDQIVELALREIGRLSRRDDASVAQHGDAVGDGLDFRHAVRNVDDRLARPFQSANDCE